MASLRPNEIFIGRSNQNGMKSMMKSVATLNAALTMYMMNKR